MKKGKAGRNSNNNNNGFLPKSLRIISSCLKTVSTNATSVASTVKSAAASISVASDDQKEQVTWAGFDKLEVSSSICRHVLLLGYQNGFQVLDVDDATKFSELVSRRDDGPTTFLQMHPIPLRSNNKEGFRKSHPLLLIVGGDESNCCSQVQSQGHLCGLEKDTYMDSHARNSVSCPKAVRFYSLRSHSYVHALRFRSAVCMVRCSPRVVAVALATQIYCFDALTLENKFSVLTYSVPQVGGEGRIGVNIGIGPMDVGPRWIAYASNSQLSVNTGHLTPQTLTPSPSASPSTSPISGGLVAHYAMESGKHLAAGIVNLGDRGYQTFSKYCQELLPDGSSSSLSLRSGSRASSSDIPEAEGAGVVVVKDFISRAIISQFRAHSTPISALCFDPSGTLLVSASVHGNTINIFRIMPSRNPSASSSQSYDCSSSCVHLYKLHRGIRAAIIQDICFSCYSQWISIVSSKGTCHVFVLSPFGGGIGVKTLNSHSDEPSIAPVLTLPWWSSSSCTISQQSIRPPPLVTLSVVSRIKDNNSGLLNTVNNVAASMSGKVSVPSGALAAVFHNSIPCNPQQVGAANKSFEHLLVYTPSGHVVQHEIEPSFGIESDGDSRPNSSSFVQSQDPGLNIHIHPVQWWDVCRRSDWPEREDFVFEIAVYEKEASVVPDNQVSSTCGPDSSQMNTSTTRSCSLRTHSSRYWERANWYLSNAEVQYSTGRLPAWQKSKISFCVTGPPRVDDDGEYEIEKLPTSEVQIRRKDLLPVFDNFHSMKSAFKDRRVSAGIYASAFSLEPSHPKDKATRETIICHSKPASFSSTESSDGGTVICEFPRDKHLLVTHEVLASGIKLPSVGVPETVGAIGLYNHTNASNVSSPKSLLNQDEAMLAATCDSFKETSRTFEPSGAHINAIKVASNAAVKSSIGARESNSKHEEEEENDDDTKIGLFQKGSETLDPDGVRKRTDAACDSADSSTVHFREHDLDEDGDDDMLGAMFAFFEEG